MALQYAGVDVCPLTPDLRLLCERWWADNAPDLWSYTAWNTERIGHLPIPPMPMVEKAPLNTLVWPTGASRWAVFHTLVGGADLAAIQAAIHPSSPISAALVLTDERTGNSISAQMFYLAARPMFVQDSNVSRQLWWITLVDQRYYWWMARENYTFNVGNSWATLLGNLITAVGGLTPTIPSIPAAYQSPNGLRWSEANRPLPLIIDAAATTIGLRLTVGLDLSLKFVNAATASANDASQYTTYKSELGYGGVPTIQQICGIAPASVAVTFWGDLQSVKAISLTSLSLAPYSGQSGVANTYAWISGDLDASVVAGTQITYAQQAAIDYYTWIQPSTDATFRGVIPWIPTGQEDRIEWEWMPGIRSDSDGDGNDEDSENVCNADMPWKRVLTRIVRQDWADQNAYGDRPPPGYTYTVQLQSQGGSGSGIGSGAGSGGEVTTTVWSASIMLVDVNGKIITGPQLGWSGANTYVLYQVGTGNPRVGDTVTAVPDPMTAGVWTFNSVAPSNQGTRGSYTYIGGCACCWFADAEETDCYTLSVSSSAGACSCVNTNQSFYLIWQGSSWRGDQYLNVCGEDFQVDMTADATNQPQLTLTAIGPDPGAGGGQGSQAPVNSTHILTRSCCDYNTVSFCGGNLATKTVLCTNSRNTDAGPGGNTFSVDVLYTTCPPITSLCCGTAALPQKVCVTFTASGLSTPNCDSTNFSLVLTYGAAGGVNADKWFGQYVGWGNGGTCNSVVGNTVGVLLGCYSGQWGLYLGSATPGNSTYGSANLSMTCATFTGSGQLTVSGSWNPCLSGSCRGSFIQYTVSVAPLSGTCGSFTPPPSPPPPPSCNTGTDPSLTTYLPGSTGHVVVSGGPFSGSYSGVWTLFGGFPTLTVNIGGGATLTTAWTSGGGGHFIQTTNQGATVVGVATVCSTASGPAVMTSGANSDISSTGTVVTT